MRYSATTPASRQRMMDALGIKSVDDLFASIPDDVLDRSVPDVAGPLNELDLLQHLDTIKGTHPRVSLAGAGLYEHFIPATVDSLSARGEWLTAYTPYQAEISQGTLAMYYEFQTFMAMLTGQEISNGGMYDGSTALAEAAMMALRLRPRSNRTIYVSEGVHPEYREVLSTYLSFMNVSMITCPVDPKTGRTVFDGAAEDHDQSNATAIVVQSPNFFGTIEDTGDLADDAFVIGVCTEALSLSVIQPMKCDILVGECQSLGIPMQLGGPTAGFFATSKKHVRKMPGRLVGRTVDANGEEAFCVTLATREQFIRREKATSNICTSSGLMCLRATIYMALLGRKGLEDTAEKSARAARRIQHGLAKLGLPRVHDGPFFNEFVVDISSCPDLYQRLKARGFILGVPLDRWFPERKHQLLIAATEMHYATADALVEEVASHV